MAQQQPHVNRIRKRLEKESTAALSNITRANNFARWPETTDEAQINDHSWEAKELLAKLESHATVIDDLLTKLTDEAIKASSIIQKEVNIDEDLDEYSGYVTQLNDAAAKMRPIAAMVEIVPVREPLHDQVERLLNIYEAQQVKTTTKSETIKLPTLNLVKFDGDIYKWRTFWDIFEASVDKREDLEPIQKLQYLQSALEGTASKVIGNISLSNDNYATAVSLLKMHFADDEKIIQKVRNRLIHLSPVEYNPTALRQFKLEIEGALQCLESIGEKIDDRHYVDLIMSKLPRQLIVQLQRLKGHTEKWTMSMLKAKLFEEIAAEEAAESFQSEISFANLQQHETMPTTAHALVISQTKRQGVGPLRPTNRPPTMHRPNYQQLSQIATKQQPRFQQHQRQYQQRGTVTNQPTTGFSQNTTNRRPTSNCVFCGDCHWNSECQAYPSHIERRQRIPGRCFLCLKEGHSVRTCQQQHTCRTCNAVNRHHNTLCPLRYPTTQVVDQSNVASQDTKVLSVDISNTKGYGINADTAAHNAAATSVNTTTHLQTALVKMSDTTTTQNVETRALFDCCSSRSYITEQLAEILRLPRINNVEISINRFAGGKPVIIQASQAVVRVHTQEGEHIDMNVVIVPHIVNNITRFPIHNPLFLSVTKKLNLADPPPDKIQSCDVPFLIGNDYYMDVVDGTKQQVYPNGPYILASKVGWILSGKATAGFEEEAFSSLSTVNVPPTGDEDEAMRRLWDLETLGIQENPNLTDDDRAAKVFDDTIRFENERYQVVWPWRENANHLPINYQLALGRFNSLTVKFQRRKDLLESCNKIIKDQLAKCVIEIVDKKPTSHKVTYLPFHPVETPAKNTTKTRIVYDASAKSGKGSPSLNDCLYRGPVQLESLLALLLRFRFHRIAIVADIEKAFLQIGLQPQERDVTRFFWFKDSTKNPSADNLQILRFTRVLFGATSSPFLLERTVRHHLSKYTGTTSSMLQQDHYVDNIVTGTATVQEAVSFYKESKTIFAHAAMNLREYQTSESAVRNWFDPKDRASEDKIKVLGMQWYTKTDQLAIASDQLNAGTTKRATITTKRAVLSQLSKVFDPMGLVAPITIRSRLLMQSLCRAKLSWDEPLSGPQIDCFRKIETDLSAVQRVKLQRFLTEITNINRCIMVAFCDASREAYAAVIYIRYPCPTSGIMKSDLLLSKNRVAPLKQLSIPRLELMSMLIAVRLIKFAKESLKHNGKVVLFSDSQCVLHWLNTNKCQGSFVENRLKEIRNSPNTSFRYIDTTENPADLATRGKDMEKLDARWWHGPSWITKLETEWPHWTFDQHNLPREESSQQSISNPTLAATGIAETFIHKEPPFGINLERYSKFRRLIRVTAWCNRFINRVRKRKQNLNFRSLHTSEIKTAEEMWIIHVQSNYNKDRKIAQTKQLGLHKNSGRANTMLSPACQYLSIRSQIVTHFVAT